MKQIAVWSWVLVLVTSCVSHAKEKTPPPAKDYEILATVAPAPVQRDGQAKFSIVITPRSPWILKTSTPLTIKLTATPGITLVQSQFRAADLVDAGAPAKAVNTTLHAKSGGEQSVSGELTFFLCNDKMCKRQQDKLQTPVVVK